MRKKVFCLSVAHSSLPITTKRVYLESFKVAKYPLCGAKKQIHHGGAMMPRDLTILLSRRACAPRPAHQGQSHSAAGTAHPGVPNSPAGSCSARTTPPPAPGIAPSPAPRSSTSDGATAGRCVHRRSNTGGTPAKNHQTQWFRHEAA